MDARITKQRLAIFLSYDWLKILAVIAVTVLGFYLLFTMITVRPTIAQVYTVYSYGGLRIGNDSASLAERLKGKFSYDILETEMENFEEGSMGEQALTARRGVLEGDAVIAANYTDDENSRTAFEQLCLGYGRYRTPEEGYRGFYDIPAFLDETKEYLSYFFDLPLSDFDETFVSEAPIEERVEEVFLRRNGSDKRFKTQAQKETGIAGERARLMTLRENYVFVRDAFDRGDLYTVDYVIEQEGGEPLLFPVGIGLGKLTGISELFFYYNKDQKATEDLVLLFFDNGYRVEDARYENWTFVRYLLETYAPAHS